MENGIELEELDAKYNEREAELGFPPQKRYRYNWRRYQWDRHRKRMAKSFKNRKNYD